MPHNKGIYGVFHHSEETKKRMSKAHKGDKSYTWKGDRASYESFHMWLSNNYGRPKECSFCHIKYNQCLTSKGLKPKKYPIHYALIHGRKHSHDINNYIPLCFGCHRKYDFIGKKHSEEHKKKISEGCKGKNIKDLTGMVFGKLQAIKLAYIKENVGAFWLFKCDCGNKKIIRGAKVKSGDTKSCGCLNKLCYLNLPKL